MFGDLGVKREKNVRDHANFQQKRAEAIRQQLLPPPQVTDLFISYNFLFNFTESVKVGVRVSLMVNDVVLLQTNGFPAVIEDQLVGSVDKKNLDIQRFTHQHHFSIDYSQITQQVLAARKGNISRQDTSQKNCAVILFRFSMKDKLIAWYFHPLLRRSEEEPEKLHLACGRFIANTFYPPHQQPPFGEDTKKSYIIFGYGIADDASRLKELPIYNVSQKIKKDDQLSLFIKFNSIKGLPCDRPAELTYTIEVFNLDQEYLPDRMNDTCQVEDRLAVKTVSREEGVQFFDHLDYFNVSAGDLIEAQASVKIQFFPNNSDEEMGSLIYKLCKNGEVVEGEYAAHLRYGYKMTNLLLSYKIYMQKIDEIRCEKNYFHINIMEVRNYLDPYKMSVSFDFIKGSSYIMDEFNDSITYASEEFYKPLSEAVCFEELTLHVPVNYEQLKVHYKNGLQLLYIRFKFFVNIRNKIELFGWYNHSIFLPNKELNTGKVTPSHLTPRGILRHVRARRQRRSSRPCCLSVHLRGPSALCHLLSAPAAFRFPPQWLLAHRSLRRAVASFW